MDWLTNWHTYLLISWLTDRLAHWLTDGLTDWLTHWLTDWQIDSLIDRLTHSLAHWLTDWASDWLTDLLIDWHTDGLTDWLTGWQTDLLIDRSSSDQVVDSNPTLVRVFVCPRVGPFPFLRLTLRWDNLGISQNCNVPSNNYLDHSSTSAIDGQRLKRNC